VEVEGRVGRLYPARGYPKIGYMRPAPKPPTPPLPTWRKWFLGLNLILLVATPVFVVNRACHAWSQRSEPRKPTEWIAWDMTKVLVEKRLKAPATAEWPRAPIGDGGTDDMYVRSRAEGEYEVSAWVDSQNTFGALIRTDFRAVVRFIGNDEWALVEFEPRDR
jgi:hypothetical protein